MREITELVPVLGGKAHFPDAQLILSLYLPERSSENERVELLYCVHGGSYTRRYWHALFDGFSGYSFAEHMTSQGFVVAAIDMLGMGESSRPPSTGAMTFGDMVTASQEAFRAAVTRLEELGATSISSTGIGHSLGGMMVIAHQATYSSFDRLAALGWSNDPLLQSETRVTALLEQCEAAPYLPPQGELVRSFFYGEDVPEAVALADEAAAVETPSVLTREALTPGLASGLAATVKCPVFIAQGSIDTSLDPHHEPSHFRESDDVTLMVLRDTAHCHNLARHRHRLWQRIGDWASSLPAA